MLFLLTFIGSMQAFSTFYKKKGIIMSCCRSFRTTSTACILACVTCFADSYSLFICTSLSSNFAQKTSSFCSISLSSWILLIVVDSHLLQYQWRYLRELSKKTWREIVEKDCRARGLNTEDAMCRSRWR